MIAADGQTRSADARTLQSQPQLQLQLQARAQAACSGIIRRSDSSPNHRADLRRQSETSASVRW
jgi:hypothetical protein